MAERVLLSLLMLLVFTHIARSADAAPVSIELAAQPATANVGDTIQVTITYRWPVGWTAPEPDPGAAFSSVFVTAAPPPQVVRAGGEERRVWRLSIAADHSGAWALPRPRFSARGPDGAVNAEAPEVIVQIGTDAAKPALPALRPLIERPPTAPENSHRWWWLSAAIVGAAGLAVAALYWRRALAIAGPTAREIFTRDVAAVARASDGKEAGAALSLALRRYAGAVWGFDGAGATTREIAIALRGRAPDAEARGLARLLDHLDGLRWAADDLAVAAVVALVADATAWTDGVQTRLDAEAAAAQEAQRSAKKTNDRAPAEVAS